MVLEEMEVKKYWLKNDFLLRSKFMIRFSEVQYGREVNAREFS